MGFEASCTFFAKSVRRPGFAFYGMVTSRVQAWQPGRYDFEYHNIATLIP